MVTQAMDWARPEHYRVAPIVSGQWAGQQRTN